MSCLYILDINPLSVLIICFCVCVLFLQDQCDSGNKWMNEYPYEEENNKGWLVKLYNCSGSPILNINFGQLFSLEHFFVCETEVKG